MVRRLASALRNFLLSCLALVAIMLVIAYVVGADIHYGDNPLASKVGDEGPHVFYQGDNVVVSYIRGGKAPGFSIESTTYPADSSISAEVQFPLDGSRFSVEIHPDVGLPPPSEYQTTAPILVISDVESNFKAMRDFLIAQDVITTELSWAFGSGHLVLTGDFVDRGFSTTQVLWLIYKLEQEAASVGGKVHYILGNHEVKNLQGNYLKAAYKYTYIAGILGLHQYELFADSALLGRWLASKNAVEKINDTLFLHGGIAPQIADQNLSLGQINNIVRAAYRTQYFNQPEEVTKPEDVLNSTTLGVAWYRGLLAGKLAQTDVDQILAAFDVRAMVVGHTPQRRVRSLYEGSVFAVNVKHPTDYRGTFPSRRSEGLYIHNRRFYRALDDGRRLLL